MHARTGCVFQSVRNKNDKCWKPKTVNLKIKTVNPEFRMSRVDGIPEWAYFFLGVKTQNFSSASNKAFSQPSVKAE